MNDIYLFEYRHLAALGIGFLLDLLFGDPRCFFHPVCLMGKMISGLEHWVRKKGVENPKKLLAGGAFLCIVVLVFWTVISWVICTAASVLHFWLGILIESFFCYQLLAVKGLKTESMKVYDRLAAGDLEGARTAVSMIVGRDTASLDEAGITRAAVETVAENLSDGVIAPLCFMALGGAPFGFLYKAVNTMDSMIGYKNERYLYIGRCAARLDDVLNFLPARLSALLILLSCPFLGLDMAEAYRIWKRDGRNHASPNSAQTEAAAAGALGIQLAGNAYYFGKLCRKPTIGDRKREIQYEDIRTVNRLLYVASWIALLLICTITMLLH